MIVVKMAMKLAFLLGLGFCLCSASTIIKTPSEESQHELNSDGNNAGMWFANYRQKHHENHRGSESQQFLQMQPSWHLFHLKNEHQYNVKLLSSQETHASDEIIDIQQAQKILHHTDPESAGNGRKVENYVTSRLSQIRSSQPQLDSDDGDRNNLHKNV